MARTRLLAVLCTTVGLALWSGLSPCAPAIPATASPLEQPLSQPDWAQLKPQQKQILAPLAKDWDGMESFRRKKWLGIAKRYPSMTPEQQKRVQMQMKPWASPSPEERNAARQKFKKQHMAPHEQREAKRQKWEEYQALPESVKQKFREKAAKQAQARKAGNIAPRPLTHPATLAPALSPQPPSGPAAAK